MQQDQDCLQLNEQINTAFIRLIALFTDNFQVQLRMSQYDMVSTVDQMQQHDKFYRLFKRHKEKWSYLARSKSIPPIQATTHTHTQNNHKFPVCNTWHARSVRATNRFRANKLCGFLIKI